MARRRMFSLDVIDSDIFLDMPQSSQNLYFHLCMRADDDGFLNNYKKIQRMTNCSDDDMKILLAKKFVLPFENGIIVITHWKLHNYIQSDRYKETIFLDEKKQITQEENGVYTKCIHDVSTLETQVRLGKDSIGKDKTYTPFFTPPSVEAIAEYCKERRNNINADQFFNFYQSKGWMVGKNKMKDWKACVRTWEQSRTEKGNTNQYINEKQSEFNDLDRFIVNK